MPKATLEFNLPEETQEHLDAIKGTDWKLVAWDVDQLLRKYLKYGCEDCEDNRDAAFELIRKELWNSIEEKGLTLLD